MPKNLSESNEDINKILGVDIQYEVPLYQRRYVWNKINWETLWENIFDLAKLKPHARGEGHFTGPIVTRSIAGAQNKYEVIDGQQRLTTFEIIFCVIRDLCSGLEDLRDNATITDAEEHVLSGSNHKLIPTIYDREAFKEIVDRKYGKEIHNQNAFDENENCLIGAELEKVRLQVFGSTNVSASILDAYHYFYKKIRNHVQKDSDEIANLIGVIKNDFKIIHLSLGETEQAEKVFESINATGRMLLDFDYLRNDLFLRARNLGKIDDVSSANHGRLRRDVFYEDSDYWRFENESNYWDTEKLESFLRAFLRAAWNPRCFKEKNAKPFGEYQKYSKKLEKTYPDDDEKIPFEFKQLSGWAKSYRLLQDDPAVTDFKNFCKDLSLPDLNSFLLFVKHKHSSTLSDVCRILESYIVRRMLVLENAECNHAQIKRESFKNIEEFFSDIVTNNATYSKDLFVNFLENRGVPNDIEVMTAFEQVNSKNAAFIAYVFRRIASEEKRVYGMPTLNWGDHVELSTEIRNRLEDLTDLNNVFSHLWPQLYAI